jgi:hypothetical protein
MRRSVWIPILATMSALTLLIAACGTADDEGMDAPREESTENEEAPEPIEPEQVTAYVVGYHWGWALFDEDGTELDVLEVTVGTEVELVAVNDHASHAIGMLPEPVAEAVNSISWSERTQHDVEMGRIPDPAVEEGISVTEALAIAHEGHDHVDPEPDHGLLVAGIGTEVFLDSHADEPERMVFTVEREGAHQFRCTEDCGFGHKHSRWEMLVVTA